MNESTVPRHSIPRPAPGKASPRETDERLVTWMLKLLQASGGDVERVLRRSGLNCTLPALLEDELRRISTYVLVRISAEAAVALGDLEARDSGREPFRGDDWRLLFYCLVGARSLREAAERATAFMRAVDGRCGLMELHEIGGVGELRWEAPANAQSLLSLVCATFGMINLHGLFSWLIGRRIELIEASVAHDEHLLDRLEPGLIQLPLSAGERTQLRFPAHYLDYPVVGTLEDFSLRTSLCFLVAVTHPPARDSLVERARALMFEALKGGEGLLSLSELAAALQLNRDTFRRRLRDTGASYNQLKDSCRRELGLDLLHRTDLSIEMISDRLGFCDSDAFRIAVRTWVGVSPSSYRRAA